MITAVVQFKLPEPISEETARAKFSSTAPKYQSVPGLVRKYYLLSEDGAAAGGVYLWETREQAELFYTDAWKRFIEETYGAEPFIQYFLTPVVVDNPNGEILGAA